MNFKLLCGPTIFIVLALGLQSFFPMNASVALATTAWMGVWWVFRPVSITITAFLPIAVNAIFNIAPMPHIINPYFSEIVILLLGSDIISMTWAKTGLDKRLSLRALSYIGPSLKQQIFVWLVASTILSIFLPNVVVCGILIPIAVSMLRFVGESSIADSKLAVPILLAVAWGAGIGGFGSPLGGAANLVAINYIEETTGHEFMYFDWVLKFLPFLILIMLINFFVLCMLPTNGRQIQGSKEYFIEMYAKMGKMSKDESFSFWLFILATVLAFVRPLYASYLPGLKPAYVFFILGFVTFFAKASDGKPFLNWDKAQKDIMWGMMFLFSGGIALGKLMTDTKAVDYIAAMVSELPLTGGIETIFAFSIFSAFLTEISSNTAAASIAIPVVKSISQALSLNPAPFILLSIVSVNCAYALPLSIRAIPVSHGLSPESMFKYGLLLSGLTIAATTLFGWLAMQFWPWFAVL
ncbi:MAG: SLC13 family permease [Selenomonadaceae bacterium]|nr:SLC13 family permease [Selenomonadaceae bacterium]